MIHQQPHFKRDENSGAVLNTDVAALNKYKSERALYRKVAKLTSELEEIKAIVMSLSERLDNIENK